MRGNAARSFDNIQTSSNSIRKTACPLRLLYRRSRREITMKNILIVLVSSTILATANMSARAQSYLYGFPSDGVSRGPYGNSDIQRYRHNDWRSDSNDWRSQRNDFRNSNDSVWRRERNDWQKTDDWRTRVRPDETETRGASRDADRSNANERNNINNAGVYDNPSGSPQESPRQSGKTSPMDEDCRGPWRRGSNPRCR